MAVLSVLFKPAASRIACLQSHILRSPMRCTFPNVSQKLVTTPVRSMGGGGPRKMTIIPSRHTFNIFKDQVHFYVLLAVIPLSAVMLYANVFIGPATLTDIPEDYEPKHWEYYKHPIQRWFARYVYAPPEESYEISLHHYKQVEEKKTYKLLERKVLNLMKNRGDYKDWYYAEIQDRKTVAGSEFHDDVEETWSFRG